MTAAQLTHKHRQPIPKELQSKMPVLARFNGTVEVAAEDPSDAEGEKDVWFPAKILRRIEPFKYELRWNDGDESFFARWLRESMHRVLYPPPLPFDLFIIERLLLLRPYTAARRFGRSFRIFSRSRSTQAKVGIGA